jgi:anti-anti-sigma factor
MEVRTATSGDSTVVTVIGRLDGYWADQLDETLNQVIREGSHRICLDLSQVPYISSAGVGAVVRSYKQLKDIHGSLAISDASAMVRKVFEVSGLGSLLQASMMQSSPARPAVALPAQAPAPASAPVTPAALPRRVGPHEVHDLDSRARLTCHVVGDPGLLHGSRFTEEHVRKMQFPDSSLAFGLGAFGEDFAECRSRFGDFLVAGGAAAYQPSDRSNVPDYLLAAGDLRPELMVLYGAVCDGSFSQLVRFQPVADKRALSLSELAASCLEIAEAPAVGIVMVNDSAGLIGASLRQSPAAEPSAGSPFRFPDVRKWLSFTADRAYPRALTLVVGIAARGKCGALDPLLRPLRRDSDLCGHFHAAAFSYRPVKKGSLELKATVATLFETTSLQGVLHLLADDREIEGAGESEFVRGACWISPLGEIQTGNSPS